MDLGTAAAEAFSQHPDYVVITSFPGLADSPGARGSVIWLYNQPVGVRKRGQRCQRRLKSHPFSTVES
jgi:hypothetical protein